MWFQDRPCAGARVTASRRRASSARTASAAVAISRRSSVRSLEPLRIQLVGQPLESLHGLLNFSICVSCHRTSSKELVELGSQRLGVDDDWIVAFEIENADLKQRSALAGPISMTKSPFTDTRRMALRAACHMSASATPCFRAGPPIRP